jgi:DNA-binding CsgD family transcriptional regulator
MSLRPLGTDAAAAKAAIVSLCARDLPPLGLLEQVAHRVRSVVPYTAAGWLLTDPATMLVTCGYSEDVADDLHLQLIDNEYSTEDYSKFSEVARLPRPVRLSEATGGEPSRSTRYRTLYEPAGYGDELRAAFRSGGTCWGVACLTRAAGEPDFTAPEIDFLASVCDRVGEGVRKALLLEACQPAGSASQLPGMLVLGEDDELLSLTGEAESWLAELPADDLDLPNVVYAVARRARALGAGAAARARVRLRSGGWVLVHGAMLRGTGGGPMCTAVLLEPARRADLAPLLVELYGLTEREGEIVQLLVAGMSIEAIAEALWISRHTVRDHVKAVFAKLEVRSRPELTALLFHEQISLDSQSGVWNSGNRLSS